MTNTINEFLRFESSNQLSNRRARYATRIGGVDIAKGSLLTLYIGAANRDPAQFAQPEQLLLKRPNNRHLAFGFGIHQCAGMSLARLKVRIAISRFFAAFPGLSPDRCADTRWSRTFQGVLASTLCSGLNCKNNKETSHAQPQRQRYTRGP